MKQNRQTMCEVLTRNEIDWLLGGNASHDELQEAIKFFAKGGWAAAPDTEIENSYNQLIA